MDELEPETLSDRLNEALNGRHTATVSAASWFHCEEDTDLAPAFELFAQVAISLLLSTPDGPELTIALRKLLEARDSALRAQASAGVF